MQHSPCLPDIQTSLLQAFLHVINLFHSIQVPPWVTASCFLARNREAELKPTTFSSLLLFCVFLSFIFSQPPQRYTIFECCLFELLNNNNVFNKNSSIDPLSNPFFPHGRIIGEHFHQSFCLHLSSPFTAALSVHSGLYPIS